MQQEGSAHGAKGSHGTHKTRAGDSTRAGGHRGENERENSAVHFVHKNGEMGVQKFKRKGF